MAKRKAGDDATLIECKSPERVGREAERAALVSLFVALGGENWKQNDNWLSKAPLSRWHGVTINGADGPVTGIELSGNNVRGDMSAVAAAADMLPRLDQLWLSDNPHLEGTLPESLATGCPQLSILDVGSCRLSGVLPHAFVECAKFSWLVTDGNELSPFARCAGGGSNNGSDIDCETARTLGDDGSNIHGSSHDRSAHVKACRAATTEFDLFNSDLVHDHATNATTDATAGSVSSPQGTTPKVRKPLLLGTVHETPGAVSPESCGAFVKAAEEFAALQGGWGTQRHRQHATTDVDCAACPALLALSNQALREALLPLLAALFGVDAHACSAEDVFVVKYSAAPVTATSTECPLRKLGGDDDDDADDDDGGSGGADLPAAAVKAQVTEGGATQSSLGVHRDGSELSFVVLLNDPLNDFQGGGTAFFDGDGGASCGDDLSERGDRSGFKAQTQQKERVSRRLKQPRLVVAPRRLGSCVSFCGLQRHAGLAITSGVRYVLAGFVRVHDNGATRGAAEGVFNV